ncbi:glyoxal reductase-like, partial [Chironomus tepperi]|uniref:glyoxal reductase-like n=1 Tax=Chironomus tepperi TaxID=113505 RepID=UPI00391EF620
LKSTIINFEKRFINTVGTYLIKGTEFTNQVIDDALSVGYRLFDTAENYRNEEFLGLAFKKSFAKYNLTRKDIFITSKFEPSIEYKTEDDYLRIVNESLRKLQTDYLDLMLIHWPGIEGLPDNSTDVLKYRHEAWKALSKFKEQGLIKSIGVSNFIIRHLEDLKTVSDVVPAVNQVEFHPLCYDLELLDYCRRNGILLQAYSSLGTSGISSLRNHETVMKIAQDLNRSSSQVLLRWANVRDIAIIPKSSSRKHLLENINLDFDIPNEVMQELDSLWTNERFDLDPNDVI